LLKRKSLLLNGLLLLLCPTIIWADSANEKLQQYLNGFSNIQGEFTQHVISEDGQAEHKSLTSGLFWIQKPGKFRWQYLKPFEQDIISNGKKIWVYDKDLEQVTIRKISQAIDASPLSIFVGERAIDEVFIVENNDVKDGVDWLKLTPKLESTSFEYIEVGFKRGILNNMNLYDNFGQITQLVFFNVMNDQQLSPSVFEFDPPPGIDVFEE